MRKLVYAIGLGLILGSSARLVQAACVLGGAFCADDTGQYVGGILQDGNGSGLPSRTVAQLQATTPRVAGQEVWCSNCNSINGGAGAICVSTGTTLYGYMIISSATATGSCK